MSTHWGKRSINSAFVVAHEYAQKKVAYYLGNTEALDTLETMIVVQESEEQVKRE